MGETPTLPPPPHGAIERRLPDLPGSPCLRQRCQTIEPRNVISSVTPSVSHRRRAGILTSYPFSCGFRHRLRAASPSVDVRCGGNLGFAGSAVFTRFVITRPNILSSLRSTSPHGSGFNAQEMLSYHHVGFVEEATRFFASRSDTWRDAMAAWSIIPMLMHGVYLALARHIPSSGRCRDSNPGPPSSRRRSLS